MSTRREFLAALGSSAIVSLSAATPPAFLLQAAAAERQKEPANVLVIIQLTGGNDGLNTIVPYANDTYRQLRPALAIGANQVLKIDDQFGFHPDLQGMAKLFEDGSMAIVHGVGYPNPNRSHFESMDIWHTCQRKGNPRSTGWLGRYLDAAPQGAGDDAPAMHLGGGKQPLALAADHVRSPTISSLDRFRLHDGGDNRLRATVENLVSQRREETSDLLGFVQTSSTAALSAGRRVEAAWKNDESPVTYPQNRLGQNLRTVGQLIDAGLTTRVYYLELDGFDTHSQQADAHAALLRELSSAVHAFMQDVTHRGHSDRVAVMAFSEFGRRVKENASAGTDHGAAAPMFFAGSRVKSGFIGQQPSLTDLQDGDLRFHTDFRQVYAAVLEKWLGWPSRDLIGGAFDPVDLFA